ncbi:MAG TPA: GPW/gp25 family protein [Thermoanaerobaculia bacterium]|nr:GPW/gp25 family protein [Thermoanaerobaculia bacterium]
MKRLADPPYMSFPFRIGAGGAQRSDRRSHVREQIEQVLFTDPGDRVFRPEMGAGIRSLLFEPNASPLWTLARKRLMAALTEVLQGEVDPRSLQVDVTGEGESLAMTISYTLATLGHAEEHSFDLSAEGGSRG